MLRNLARLLAILEILLGAPALGAEPKAVTLDLIIVDYRSMPDHLTFRHGVHYWLHLENHGEETHELTAPLFFASAAIENPDVLNRAHSGSKCSPAI